MKNLKIKKSKNIRSFDDIVNKDGLKFRENFFYRGGKLYKLGKRDQKKLIKYTQIKEIIDLRTDNEVIEKPDTQFEGIKYKRMPVYSDDLLGISREKQNYFKVEKIFEMRDVYESLSEDEYLENIREIVKHILNEEDTPLLFHCTEGKDRTGIISLIILSILDFQKEDIIKDYMYTNKINKRRAIRYYWLIRILLLNKRLARNVRDMTLAKLEYLEAFIQGINKRFGSFEGFIKDYLNISDEDRVWLKEKYLVAN